MNREKGLTPVIALVVIGLIVLLLSAGAYYFLKNMGKAVPLYEPKLTETTDQNGITQQVSDSDEISVLEDELEKTEVGSPEEDFSELDSSASSID